MAITKSQIAEWHKQAEHGDAEAQYNLGNAYWYGKSVVEDKAEAVKWIHKSAEQGDAEAQYHLGVAYWDGDGVEQNQTTGAEWTRKAAEQGYAEAQFNLGAAYDSGEGFNEFGDDVDAEKIESVKWYRKAAEQGHAEAQFEVGWSYFHGNGVTEDKAEAAEWYRKAAEQGYAEAQYYLGAAYAKGYGIITDYREAYIWWSIAKAGGNEKASEFLCSLNWRDALSLIEIWKAKKEIKQRFEAINNQQRSANSPPRAAKKVITDGNTHEQTKALIVAGKNVQEIATQRNLAADTIINHIGKIHADYPDLDLSSCRPDEKTITAVRDAIAKCQQTATKDDFDQYGNLKLTPIYKQLGEAYEYNTIKLARLFC